MTDIIFWVFIFSIIFFFLGWNVSKIYEKKFHVLGTLKIDKTDPEVDKYSIDLGDYLGDINKHKYIYLKTLEVNDEKYHGCDITKR